MSIINSFNIDCMEHMKDVNDKYYDLAILDPEYGIGASKPSKKPNKAKQKNGKTLYVKSNDYKHKNWDIKPADKLYGDEIFRVSKNQFIFGANFFDWIVNTPFTPPRRNEFKDFIKEYPKGWVIWDKVNGNSDQYDCELAWTNSNLPTKIYKFMWAGMRQGSLSDGSIMEGNKQLNEKRIHPCQKPTQIYKWVLINYAKKGYKLFDSHGGSFSLAIACHDLGYNLNICEKDKEYFDDGLLRLKIHQMQQRLF